MTAADADGTQAPPSGLSLNGKKGGTRLIGLHTFKDSSFSPLMKMLRSSSSFSGLVTISGTINHLLSQVWRLHDESTERHGTINGDQGEVETQAHVLTRLDGLIQERGWNVNIPNGRERTGKNGHVDEAEEGSDTCSVGVATAMQNVRLAVEYEGQWARCYECVRLAQEQATRTADDVVDLASHLDATRIALLCAIVSQRMEGRSKPKALVDSVTRLITQLNSNQAVVAQFTIHYGTWFKRGFNAVLSSNSDVTARTRTILDVRALNYVAFEAIKAASPFPSLPPIMAGSGGAIEPWQIGRKVVTVMKGHTDGIHVLLGAGRMLFSGSIDHHIRVWDTATLQCMHTLTGHTEEVRCLAVTDDCLFSGSNDKTIRVWDRRGFACTHTLVGHSFHILALLVHGKHLFSGSHDQTIKVWDLASLSCAITLRGHSGGISALALHDGHLLSGSDDETVRVWDLDSLRCIHTLRGHHGSIYDFAVHEGRLFSASLDKTIRVWDMDSLTCVSVLTGHSNWCLALAIHDNVLYSGSYDKTIRAWDLDTLECLHTLVGSSKHMVLCLAAHGGRLFSGATWDDFISVW